MMKRTSTALAAIMGLAFPVGAIGQTPPDAPSSSASVLEGDWAGQIDTGAMKLRIVLHVHATDGKTEATMDSPDQNKTGMPVNLTVEAKHVRFAAVGGAGGFDGEIGADGASLKGQWSGAPTSLTRLAPGQTAAERRRPQTPVKPYPYREEVVDYPSSAANVHLAATLTLPEGNGPFPAVVLIAGSGSHERDENIFGHALFMVLADHLTRQGIAVLRFDKRGLGQSTGNYASATSTDFAADVEAGAVYLRSRHEIDAYRIGLIGHSEGGFLAPMVAGRDPGIAYIVMMGGPGVTGDQIIMAQAKAISAAGGMPPAAIAASQAFQRRLLDAVMAAKDEASAETAARAILKEAGLPDAAIDGQAKAVASPWFRFFLAHDPVPDLKRLRIPVLALVGSKDLQVPPEQNIPALRAALASDPRAEVAELENLNHLFQTAKTGAPSEYGEIEESCRRPPWTVSRTGF
jgi:pimeloyl-ACP methyl ester carboxylesterase